MDQAESFALVLLGCGLAMGLALLYNRVSEALRVPAPAVFLLVAATISSRFPDLHVPIATAQDVVTIALVVILFDGGLDLGWRQFREAATPIVLTGVVGTFATTAAVALLGHYVFGLSWLLALLLGTAVAPTDPAVVFSVLGRREIAGRTGTIVKGESGVNDPVGIALMTSVLAVAATSTSVDWADFGDGLVRFLLQIAVGSIVGFVGGWSLLWAMRHWPLPSAALYPLRTLAGAMVIYGLATVAHGSGFLAALIAGLLIGDERAPYKADIERFHAALSSLGEIVAFTALGLTVSLTALWHDGSLGPGIGIFALLTLVVRPLVVGPLLLPVRLGGNERLFVLWCGLKGAVPILLGTFALHEGIDGAHRLYDIVFVVVAASVIVQGGLVPAVARRLGVPMRTTEQEPFALSVRFRDEPEALRRFVLESGSPADGHNIDELPAGENFWISLVIRDGRLLNVSGETVLRAGDEVVALSDPQAGDDPGALFRAAVSGAPQPVSPAKPSSGTGFWARVAGRLRR